MRLLDLAQPREPVEGKVRALTGPDVGLSARPAPWPGTEPSSPAPTGMWLRRHLGPLVTAAPEGRLSGGPGSIKKRFCLPAVLHQSRVVPTPRATAAR